MLAYWHPLPRQAALGPRRRKPGPDVVVTLTVTLAKKGSSKRGAAGGVPPRPGQSLPRALVALQVLL